MPNADTQEMFQYRVYGNNWIVITRMQTDRENELIVEAREPTPDGEDSMISASKRLSRDELIELQQFITQLRLTNWTEDLVDDETAAAYVAAQSGQTWSKSALAQDINGMAMREFFERHANPVLHASELAQRRAGLAEEAGDTHRLAATLSESIERLGTWWKPGGPVRDETGTRFSDGKAALSRGDLEHAIMRFTRVLEMREENYRAKYDL